MRKRTIMTLAVNVAGGDGRTPVNAQRPAEAQPAAAFAGPVIRPLFPAPSPVVQAGRTVPQTDTLRWYASLMTVVLRPGTDAPVSARSVALTVTPANLEALQTATGSVLPPAVAL